MTELRERDAMMCRACGREERASEGYPCSDCGRFVCNMCNMRGVARCAECAAKVPAGEAVPESGGAAVGSPRKAPPSGA
jgi:hypothetical protein